jgi:hypothetical protein
MHTRKNSAWLNLGESLEILDEVGPLAGALKGLQHRVHIGAQGLILRLGRQVV